MKSNHTTRKTEGLNPAMSFFSVVFSQFYPEKIDLYLPVAAKNCTSIDSHLAEIAASALCPSDHFLHSDKNDISKFLFGREFADVVFFTDRVDTSGLRRAAGSRLESNQAGEINTTGIKANKENTAVVLKRRLLLKLSLCLMASFDVVQRRYRKIYRTGTQEQQVVTITSC